MCMCCTLHIYMSNIAISIKMKKGSPVKDFPLPTDAEGEGFKPPIPRNGYTRFRV